MPEEQTKPKGGRPKQKPKPKGTSAKIELVEAPKDYKKLAKVMEKDSEGLQIKEIHFSRLVAEFGYSQQDAYLEAFQPEDPTNIASVRVMATRVANRPRVKHEIERIQLEIAEKALQQNSRLYEALDGRKGAETLQMKLYSLMMSPTLEPRYVLQAAKLYGELQGVNAFIRTSNANTVNLVQGSFGVNTNLPVSEAKQELANNLKTLIEARKLEKVKQSSFNMLALGPVIDTQVVKE